MSSIKEEMLVRVRLDARHGLPPMTREGLAVFCGENAALPDEVRQAERDGRALLASGARCMCLNCEFTGAIQHERLRTHYAARRHAQLQAVGIDCQAERQRLIQAEIDAGAALQAVPATITRTGAA